MKISISISRLQKSAVVAAIGLLTPLLSHAQSVQEDLWSVDGGAWSSSYQTNFTAGSGSNGYLLPDADANSGALLYVSNATSGGLYDSYYYTFFSTPSFSLETSDILDGVNTITLSITDATSTFTSGSVALSINDTASSLTADFSSASAGVIAGFAATTYTWSWDVSSISGSINDLALGWTTQAAHTAYFEVSLTQSLAAVPEPQEYALAMAVLLLGIVIMRRRRALA